MACLDIFSLECVFLKKVVVIEELPENCEGGGTGTVRELKEGNILRWKPLPEDC
jgi:hypothetical protein